jgi:hypothetical protein
VRNPGDKELAQPWLLGLDVYGVVPNPMTQERVALPSSIGNDRGGMNRFMRMLTAPSKLSYNMSKLGPIWWARCGALNAAAKLGVRI